MITNPQKGQTGKKKTQLHYVCIKSDVRFFTNVNTASNLYKVSLVSLWFLNVNHDQRFLLLRTLGKHTWLN